MHGKMLDEVITRADARRVALAAGVESRGGRRQRRGSACAAERSRGETRVSARRRRCGGEGLEKVLTDGSVKHELR